MSRVEKNAPVQDELRAMRGEMLETVKVSGRGVGKKTGCAVILLIAMMAFGIWMAALVARTGLATIPVLTGIVFTPPAPVHTVSAGKLMEDSISEQLSRPTSDARITLRVPEDSLTASVRKVLAASGVTFVSAAKTQVAVDQGDLELFLPVEGKDTALIVRLQPGVRDGGFMLTIQSVRLGNLTLPSVIVDALLRPALDSALADFNRELTIYVHLEDIRSEAGSLILAGTRASAP